MTKPKQALNKLWNDGYFKNHRKTGEIDKICLSKYGCTCSNWTSVIKNTDFLRKKSGLWIQKYNAVLSENDKDTIFITGKQPWTDRNKKFIGLINSLKGEIKIVDPYYGIDTFQILSNFPKNKLRLITSKLSSSDDSTIFRRELHQARPLY